MDTSENNDLKFLKILFGDVGDSDSDVKDKLSGAFPGIIYVYDAKSKKLRYTNPGFTSMLGYTREEIAEWSDWNHLVYNEDLPLIQTELDRFNALESGSHLFNCRLNRKEGNWKYFRTKGTVLNRDEGGKPLSLLFIAEDISDEMEREKELLETRHLLSETEELLSYGQFSCDIAANLVTWSEGMYRIFGYAKEMVPEKLTCDWFLSQIDPEDRQRVDDTLKQAIATGKPYDLEFSIEPAGLLPRIVVAKGKAVLNKNGETIKLIGIARDVTEIRLRDRERERMIRDLHRSNMELEEFAYVASHDLQEPLRKISTFSERLRTRAKEELSPESLVYLNRILASTENMRLLIDNLLEFSRVSRNQSDFHPVAMNEVMEEVKAELELIIEESGASIKVEPLPEIEGITAHIRRMFGNLLGNAIKFREPETSPHITISAKKLSKTQIEDFKLPPDRVFYSFIVEDNGIGFDEEYKHRIFQIFQRLHGKAEYPGTGLGLAICKKIAENHGGFIYAESNLGKGSRFYVILPEKQ